MRSFSVSAAVGLCLAIVVAAPPADAFCRTTTSAVPGGYDIAAHGCWTKGTPLKWHISRVPVGVISAASSRVSLADATRELDLALAAWNRVSCFGRSPSIQAYDDGPIARVPQGGCTSDSCDPAANDYVVFDDSDWPYDDPANTFGLTTVTYRIDDGRILAAHIEINTAQHQIIAEEPPPPGAYDLQAILMHETGHFFGLADSNEPTAVMYASYRAGAIDLTPDDEEGLCSIYPPASSPSGGRTVGASCAVKPLRAEDEPLGVVGFALAIIGAIVARGRMSTRPSSFTPRRCRARA